jgi:hypothetical protein
MHVLQGPSARQNCVALQKGGKNAGGGFLDTGVDTRGRERKGEGHLLLCGGWLLDWVTGCVIVVLRQAEAGWDAATATYYSRGRS